MSIRLLPQASALVLALVATAATLGGVDVLAAPPADGAWITQTAAAPVETQRVVVTAHAVQRVVIVGHRSQA
jgi:hypothetical protein